MNCRAAILMNTAAREACAEHERKWIFERARFAADAASSDGEVAGPLEDFPNGLAAFRALCQKQKQRSFSRHNKSMGREYQCEATSIAGFVQRLAVDFIQHGHWFYVTGEVPERKEPAAVDAKLIGRYGLRLSKWARARRKDAGGASVRYLRFGRFFVLIATKGRHEFFEAEPNVQDVRRRPIRFAGYSISYRQGVDRRFHVSVRIAGDEYLKLKSYLVGLAVHRSVENLVGEFQRIRFEPYAPVRRQLLNILRAVNRVRGEAGFELVPVSALRLRRRVVRPFGWSSGGGRPQGSDENFEEAA